MLYCVLEHLPKIPSQLIAKTMLHTFGKDESISYKEDLENNRINKEFPRTPVIKELESWIRKNITNDAHCIDIAITGCNDPSIDKMQPHTDRDREYTLIYLLQNGGDEHKTVFYKHKNPDVTLHRIMNFSYNDVDEIDSIQIPIKVWTIIHSQTIHGVVNIPGRRIAIQVALEHNPWENLI